VSRRGGGGGAGTSTEKLQWKETGKERERKREKGREEDFLSRPEVRGQRVQETTKCMRSLGVFLSFFFRKEEKKRER
jgi:hypothetical protein